MIKNKFIYFIIALILASCSKKEKIEINNIEHTQKTVNKTNIVKKNKIINEFLKDVNSLKEVKHPIKSFIKELESSSIKKVDFIKENINIIFSETSNYKYIIVIVEDHTIVRIDDVKKCKNSGSWSACMPYGIGFIKKGNLNYIEDYINFIIGKPDNQKRTAYFFN